MTLSQTLVDWAWALQTSDLPESVVTALGRHVLDGLGVALAGWESGEVQGVVDVAQGLGGPAQATVFGSGVRVGAPGAALANGALIHALDFDDTHADALIHPTAVVVPAVLATAEEVGADGSAVVAALAGAYEVTLRIGAAVRHGFHRRGFHATAVCGVFGAALGAARVLGLSQTQAVDALGIAGSLSSGSLEFLHTGATTKQMHPGFAAQAGVLAARLAQAGMTGPETILEGHDGFYRAYADTEVASQVLTDGLGSHWELSRITVKPYPACQLSHAALDAVVAAGAAGMADPGLIRQITLDVPADAAAIVCEPRKDKLDPGTPYEAKFSLPWSVAALVIDGQLTPQSFATTQLDRSDIATVAARVAHRVVTSDVAAAMAPGSAEVVLTDGTRMVGWVPQSRGGPEQPLGSEQLRAKLTGCVGSFRRADDLTNAIAALPEARSLDRVMAAMTLGALV